MTARRAREVKWCKRYSEWYGDLPTAEMLAIADALGTQFLRWRRWWWSTHLEQM